MTAQTRATNKALFEQGDIPTGTNYADLIDSFLALTDTTAQSVASHTTFSNGLASTIVSAADAALNALHVAGSAAEILSAGTATFHAPIRTGSSAGNLGLAVLSQRVTVDSAHSAGAPRTIVLPPGCDIIDFLVDVEIPFAAGALATAAEIDLSAAGSAAIIARVVVSASGRYNGLDDASTMNAAQLRNVGATLEIIQSTQSLASAHTAGQAMITLRYVQNR